MTFDTIFSALPRFPGQARKNDALFLYGSTRPAPYVHTYVQQRVEIVYGPSCKMDSEIRWDMVRRDKIPVVPRRGGGGTVVLTPGMVITVITGTTTPNDTALTVFGRVHEVFCSLLADMGISARQQGISDLAVQGSKIMGSSLYMRRSQGMFFYQSSLITQPAADQMQRYLSHPPREPDYRAGRTHDAFCTSLHEQGCRSNPRDIARHVHHALCNGLRE
jgi:lipoate-protein ligase A